MRRSPRNFLNHTGGLAFIEFALIFPFLFVLLFGGIEVVRWIYIQQKVEKAGHVISDVVARYMPATSTPQAGEISVDEIVNNVFPLFARIMGDTLDASGRTKNETTRSIIITSVSRKSMGGGTGDFINWQIASPGRIGGMAANDYNQLTGCDQSAPANCVISVVNGFPPTQITPTLRNTPALFAGDLNTLTGKNTRDQIRANPLRDGENMIISEIFYKYTPLLTTLFSEENNLASATHISVILQPRIYAKRTFFIPRNGALTALPCVPSSPTCGYPVIP